MYFKIILMMAQTILYNHISIVYTSGIFSTRSVIVIHFCRNPRALWHQATSPTEFYYERNSSYFPRLVSDMGSFCHIFPVGEITACPAVLSSDLLFLDVVSLLLDPPPDHCTLQGNLSRKKDAICDRCREHKLAWMELVTSISAKGRAGT